MSELSNTVSVENPSESLPCETGIFVLFSQRTELFICLSSTGEIVAFGVWSPNAEEILSEAFDVAIEQGYYFDGILSRKLQLLPAILNVMK